MNKTKNIILSIVLLVYLSVFYVQSDNDYFASGQKISASSFNLVTAGDWGCTEDTENVAKYINMIDPELVLIPGDLSYEKTGECFFDIIKPFDSKTKIAIGNHDDEEDGTKKIKKEYLEHFNLSDSYYSFDYKNLHVLVLDTQLSISPHDDQYHFASIDLQKSSTNPSIDWIIVLYHKPMYASESKHDSLDDLRDVYHPLFEKYNVDLVIQGHNHIYERTHPLIYNKDNPDSPLINDKVIKKKKSLSSSDDPNNSNNNKLKFVVHNEKPLLVDKIDNYYENPEGSIFTIVGTGGRSTHETDDKPSFISSQYQNEFGFLNVEIDGKIMIGKYYSLENVDKKKFIDDLTVEDSFMVTK